MEHNTLLLAEVRGGTSFKLVVRRIMEVEHES
jgi:hypothetical protein